MKQIEFDVKVSEIRADVKRAYCDKMDRQAEARKRFGASWDRLRKERDEAIEAEERKYRDIQLAAEQEIIELRRAVVLEANRKEGEA